MSSPLGGTQFFLRLTAEVIAVGQRAGFSAGCTNFFRAGQSRMVEMGDQQKFHLLGSGSPRVTHGKELILHIIQGSKWIFFRAKLQCSRKNGKQKNENRKMKTPFYDGEEGKISPSYPINGFFIDSL